MSEFYLNSFRQHRPCLGQHCIDSFVVLLVAFTFVLIRGYRTKKQFAQAKIELEAQKSFLCTRVSQEFKTPLSIIIGLTERIKEELATHPVNKNWVTIDILSRQTENLYTLIDSVASIANLDRVPADANQKNGNIIPYLQYLYECFSVFTEAKQISYTFHSDISELITNYDPEHVRVIFLNLIGISIKQCSEGDHLNIRICRNLVDKNYTLEVSHDGRGVLPDGVEIGLSIVEYLVEKAGGWMNKRKEKENDTVYTVVLPLENRNELAEDRPITIRKMAMNPKNQNQVKNNSQIHHENQKPIALIAQENRYLAFYLTSLMEEKFHVIVESDGEGVLKKAMQIQPDIIISDAVLSKKNGFELCRELKQHPNTEHIPVALITSTHSKEERVKGFTSGADACFERPLHEKEFLAVINQLLSSRKKIRETFSRISGVKNKVEAEEINFDEHLDFLERVTNIIYREITNTDNLIEVLSQEICLSTSQLNRKIKAITGMTTSNYILMSRLNKARKQLTNSRKPIGEVAMECGFNDFDYFSRSFKKEYGVTPTTFQRFPDRVTNNTDSTNETISYSISQIKRTHPSI